MFAILLMTLTDEEQNRVRILWQENGSALVGYARKELGPSVSPDEAEDIVSEAFAQLMTHYERYGSRTDAQMKGLLFRIVHNLCMDAYRRRKRVSSFQSDRDDFSMEPDDLAADWNEPSPEDLIVSRDNINRMKAIFRSLSPALREVLEMKLNEEMTDGEIAKELHITKHIVQQRLARARKAVRIKWEAEEHE
ncbi:MAG: sigma-70 family RNA polymerase sigma factor [Ruminococcaceae bacterium]|jgi:RNA polymerase sigma-70 factor (ECF subfamily)|nr:sigma-70 family RNA polymerase sigma factor [Oscillospiraceae bacterium]